MAWDDILHATTVEPVGDDLNTSVIQHFQLCNFRRWLPYLLVDHQFSSTSLSIMQIDCRHTSETNAHQGCVHVYVSFVRKYRLSVGTVGTVSPLFRAIAVASCIHECKVETVPINPLKCISKRLASAVGREIHVCRHHIGIIKVRRFMTLLYRFKLVST